MLPELSARAADLVAAVEILARVERCYASGVHRERLIKHPGVSHGAACKSQHRLTAGKPSKVVNASRLWSLQIAIHETRLTAPRPTNIG